MSSSPHRGGDRSSEPTKARSRTEPGQWRLRRLTLSPISRLDPRPRAGAASPSVGRGLSLTLLARSIANLRASAPKPQPQRGLPGPLRRYAQRSAPPAAPSSGPPTSVPRTGAERRRGACGWRVPGVARPFSFAGRGMIVHSLPSWPIVQAFRWQGWVRDGADLALRKKKGLMALDCSACYWLPHS